MKSPKEPWKRRLSLAAVAAILALYYYPARAVCDDDWLSVSNVHDGDAIELHATNNQLYPITISVMIESSGEAPGLAKRVTDTIDGRETRRLKVRSGGDDVRAGDLTISCEWTIGEQDATHDDDHLYLLPYATGSSYRVLQGFESDWSHRGDEQFAVDFRMPEGTPVHAARAGVVVRTENIWDEGCWNERCNGFANFVVVLHDDGTTGEYYHLQKDGVLVEVGERIFAGQQIGLSGNTGSSAVPHLHFAVYRATTQGHSQSVPVSFLSADGIVYEPRNGHYYFATGNQDIGD